MFLLPSLKCMGENWGTERRPCLTVMKTDEMFAEELMYSVCLSLKTTLSMRAKRNNGENKTNLILTFMKMNIDR